MTEQNGVAIVDQGDLTLIDSVDAESAQWRLMRSQAQVLVQSGMLPKGVTTPAAAIAIMQTGRELGLKPMQSFRNLDFIHGQVSMRANLMAALVQRFCDEHGGYIRPVEITNDKCTIEYKRADWPTPLTYTFTIDDAKTAGLDLAKGVWKQYPRNMLYARAVANACRLGWPEVASGLYDPDELGADPMPSGDLTEADFKDLQFDDHRESAMKRLHAIAAEHGIDHDGLRAIAAQDYNIGSMTEMTAQQLTDLAASIEKRGSGPIEAEYVEASGEVVDAETGEIVEDDNIDPASPIPDFMARIKAATTEEELATIAQELLESGLGNAALRTVWKNRVSTLAKQQDAQPELVTAGGPNDDPARFTA